MRVFAATTIVLGLTLPASADGEMPTITIVLNSPKELLSDLEYIIKLAGEDGEDQWETISETLEVFLGGIERGKPLRVDILTNEGVEYRISVPVDDIESFIENLDSFGATAEDAGKDLYELGGDLFEEEAAWMQVSKGYAILSLNKKLVQEFDPTKGLADLAKKHDLGVRVENSKDGQEARREFVQELAEQLLAGLEKKDGEAQGDFDFKKRLLQTQLQEGERFFAEAAKLVLGWTTDQEAGEGRLALELTAIGETELLKSIEMLGEKASYFEKIAKPDDAILFGKLNHPLDDMRKKNISDLIELARKAGLSKIEDAETRSDDEKAKGTEGLGMFLDMLNDGVKAGVADGFVQVRDNDGKHTMVGGIATPDGTKMIEFLNLFAAGKKTREVKLDVDSDGDVKIHSVSVPEKYQDLFTAFFSEDTKLYVGTSKEAVWFSTGHNAVAEMNAGISAVNAEGEAEVSKTFIELFVKVGPWIKFIDERRVKAEKENPPSDDEKEANAMRDKLRSMAIEAFDKGDDTIHTTIGRVDDHVEGVTKFGKGILRFIGMAIADFAEQTL